MQYSLLSRAVLMVGNPGTDVSCVTADGKVKWVVGFLPGPHELKQLLKYMRPSDHLEFDAHAIPLLSNGDRLTVSDYGPRSVESGANPNWRPTRATDMELQVRKLGRQMVELRRLNASLRENGEDKHKLRKAKRKARRLEPEAENEIEEETTSEETSSAEATEE